MMRAALLLTTCAALACSTTDGGGTTDAAIGPETSSGDGDGDHGADGDHGGDGDGDRSGDGDGDGDGDGTPTGCDLDRAQTFRGGDPIEQGVFCDDIFTCVDDADAEAQLKAAAPAFDCSWDEDPLQLCEAGQTACQWTRPGVIDEAAAADVCAATVSGAAPELVCIVWE